jgi:DNA-binding CsgD family transcriptional regulator
MTMGVGRGRFDAIGVVEASYALDLPMGGWLQRLLESSSPWLDRGYGALAVVWEPDPLVFTHVEVRGTPDMMKGHLARWEQTFPRPGVLQLRRQAGTYRSFSETMRDGNIAQQEFFRQEGDHSFEDYIALGSFPARHRYVQLGAMTDRLARTTPSERRLWETLGAHVTAGLGLMEDLSPGDSTSAEAVFTPDGRCVHAEGEARSTTARELLRHHARCIEKARGPLRRRDPEAALSLWKALVAGRWTIVDRWDADGRRYLVARRNQEKGRDPRALTAREVQAVEGAMRGEGNAQIAHALGIDDSTVATHLSRALRKLVLRRREHLLDGRGRGQVTHFQLAAMDYAVQSVDILGWLTSRSSGLTGAEQQVALLAVAGLSDVQIGQHRGTSPRTVANQLRSIFLKLGVRSRSELALRLENGPDEAAPAEGVPG